MTTLTLVRPAGTTPEQAKDEALRAVRARSHLLDFCQWIDPYYIRAPHIELLAGVLEAVERGDIDRVIVEEPPRHGKSLLGSIYFPAWYLARNPRKSVITASYGAELGHEFGRRARNTLMDPRCQEIFPGVEVVHDSKAAHRWNTNHGGYLIASGIPGPITGRGAHLLNIDDPIKNRAEAESEAYREGVWQWYLNDARTRLEPDGAVVLTQTRWHKDDLAGRLQREQPGRWRVISLPAIAEKDDPLGRQSGEALWPERYDLKALTEIKNDVGERAWSSLYQQRPAPAEGLLFKWFPRWPADAPTPQTILVPIDTAITGTDTSDYWAWSAWGVRGKNIDLLTADRVKAEPPVAEEHIFTFLLGLRQQYPAARITPLVRKSVAIDRMAASHLRARKIPVVEIKLPSMGGRHVKEGLAAMIVDYFQSGLARVPEDASVVAVANEGRGWLEKWIQEHKGFNTAPHDHWVENTIVALHAFRGALVEDVPRDAARDRYGHGGNE